MGGSVWLNHVSFSEVYLSRRFLNESLHHALSELRGMVASNVQLLPLGRSFGGTGVTVVARREYRGGSGYLVVGWTAVGKRLRDVL